MEKKKGKKKSSDTQKTKIYKKSDLKQKTKSQAKNKFIFSTSFL